MDDDELLERLEQIASGLGYEIRYQPCGGKSGKCVIHGRKVAVIDSGCTTRGRADALAMILAGEDLEHVYLPPAVRMVLDTYRAS